MTEKKLILIIDDSEIDRMILEELVSSAGHDVILAEDGDEGLKVFGEKQPDLVITDMVMPGKMGVDVIWELQKSAAPPKIIALSAGGDFGPELELATAKTMNVAAIAKPVDPAELLSTIAELLKPPPEETEPEA